MCYDFQKGKWGDDMSCYNYTHFIKEFADRTTENLQIIESSGEKHDRKEITQLINSFLGLLVVPSERYKESRDEKEKEENTLKSFSPEMYERIARLITQLKGNQKLYNGYEDATKYPVCEFIHHLRNAVCHSGNNTLIFTPIEEYKEIETVIFYDTCPTKRGMKYEFCAELTVAQIRRLIVEISMMYVAVENAEAKAMQEAYEATVLRYRGLMKKEW